MTPDQRMQEALADLQAQLEHGEDSEVAIADVANAYGFRTDVIAKRAVPLGPLAEVGPRAADRIEREHKAVEVRNAIRNFCSDSSGESFEQWMIKHVGRAPTEEEHFQAFDATARHLVNEMLKTEKFKDAQNR